MDHHQPSNNEWATQHREALTTRHSHEDVLNDREFELLLEASGDLPAPRGFEARVICLLGGRLGRPPGRRDRALPGCLDRRDSETHSNSQARAVSFWVLSAASPTGSRPQRPAHRGYRPQIGSAVRKDGNYRQSSSRI